MILKKSFVVATFSGALVYCVFFTPGFLSTIGVKDYVDAEKIRMVPLQSSEERVLSILGEPLKRIEFSDRDTVVLYYSKRIFFPYTQPKVVITLESGFVAMIEVQKTILWGEEFDRYYYFRYKDELIDSDELDDLL